jgi:hypothetical protein
MIRKIQILIIGLFFSISLFSQELTEQLEKAYTNKSHSDLKEFFKNWESSIKTSDFESLNDTNKAIYEIYKEFYTPNHLSRIGYSEWGNNIYRRPKYFVIQDEIYYGITQTLYLDTIEINKLLDNYPPGVTYKMAIDSSSNRKNFLYRLIMEHLDIIKKDTLENFRPEIKIPMNKTLFLSNEYRIAINTFLDKELDSTMTFSEKVKGKTHKRQKYLNRYIKIIQGHWGKYWYIETHPYVNSILIDKNLERAKVYFRLVYQHGEADLVKTEEGWQITNSGLTGIE